MIKKLEAKKKLLERADKLKAKLPNVIETDEERALRHQVSELSKDLNRVCKMCSSYGESNRIRKIQQKEFSLFGDWLLKNKRVTKTEMKRFIHRKEINKQALKEQKC